MNRLTARQSEKCVKKLLADRVFALTSITFDPQKVNDLKILTLIKLLYTRVTRGMEGTKLCLGMCEVPRLID